eukprot:TRINITY_DN16893_c0_g1_i6.p1 TRINITY_DN16893_c0_g1~~TRINITY_DN16893_c0_g1_i6.p1  ORF type:complete len:490 (+),score=58.32 TRINITY_DN16893_c0_g1_i6:168-1637(+)
MGAWLGIGGLFLSWMILLFNSNCSTKYIKGQYTTYAGGNRTMCKESMKHHTVQSANERTGGMVVPVPYITCKHSGECASIAGGYCAGGPWVGARRDEELDEEGYCKDNVCNCKQYLYDCGSTHLVPFEFTPADYVPRCGEDSLTPAGLCSTKRTVRLSTYYTGSAGGKLSELTGCDTPFRTELLHAMLWIQHDLQEDGIIEPLVPPTDPAWNTLRLKLAEFPEVEFGSFWPSTISESVSDGMDASGRIFLGFMLCAALALLQSDYCNNCPTVDLPGKQVPFLGWYWNTLRMWLPPFGIILLAVVSMVPTALIWHLPEALMTAVHLLGAQFCFVVYLVCELFALLDEHNSSEMRQAEMRVRWFLTITGGMAMGAFGAAYLALLLFSGNEYTPYTSMEGIGMSDMYKESWSLGRTGLVRPAEGLWKNLKFVSYWSETYVAASILVSHLVICWFYGKTEFLGLAKGIGMPWLVETDESDSDATDPRSSGDNL